MKLATMFMLSLLSLNCIAFEISPVQESFIKAGHNCCYSQAVIDQVNQPTYEHQSNIILDLPPLKEPASQVTWALFYGLQILDVYTTDRALQYNCVQEVNPLLGKSPTVNDIILLKVLLLGPALWYTNKVETVTDQSLAGANYMMTAVVANNLDVWSEAKDTCYKIR